MDGISSRSRLDRGAARTEEDGQIVDNIVSQLLVADGLLVGEMPAAHP